MPFSIFSCKVCRCGRLENKTEVSTMKKLGWWQGSKWGPLPAPCTVACVLCSSHAIQKKWPTALSRSPIHTPTTPPFPAFQGGSGETPKAPTRALVTGFDKRENEWRRVAASHQVCPCYACWGGQNFTGCDSFGFLWPGTLGFIQAMPQVCTWTVRGTRVGLIRVTTRLAHLAKNWHGGSWPLPDLKPGFLTKCDRNCAGEVSHVFTTKFRSHTQPHPCQTPPVHGPASLPTPSCWHVGVGSTTLQ